MGANASIHEVKSPGVASRIGTIRSSSQWKTHFQASKQTSKLTVIYFTASWCGPCHHIQPIISEFTGMYEDVDFIKIDVDEVEAVAQEYGVQALPAFILIKKGKEVDRVVGAKMDDLRKKIETHMV